MGPLDKIPASWRHFLLLMLGVALGYAGPWAQANYTNWNLPVPITAMVGASLPYVVLWSTTLTTQYGFTGKPAAEVPPVA